MTQTCSCGRDHDGTGFICNPCSKALEIALGNVAAYWADLDTVKGRQTRYRAPSGARPNETPPVIDARFAALEWVTIIDEASQWVTFEPRIPAGTALVDAVRNTVATWTRLVMDGRPVIHGPMHAACLHTSCSTIRRSRLPADNVSACCVYLLGHVDWIRGKDWAPQILDELDHLELQLQRIVDRPADRWYAGPCDGCERDLYAKVGAKMVDCDDCDRVYDIAVRRAALLVEAEDRLVNATELARAVSWLGTEPLNPMKVRVWAHRGRIVAKGHEERSGKILPLYRVGDALDLMATDTKKAG